MEHRAKGLRQLSRAAGDLLLEAGDDVEIQGLAYDSRSVRRGDLFFCVPGAARDGHEYAAAAVEAGAAALCVQRRVPISVPQLLVSDVRRAAGRIAAEFHGRPGERLDIVGITGTNGKTTTAFLVESILATAGRRTGLIGTIETRIAGRARPGVRTTPDAVDLQALLAEMSRAGVDSVAMEVTSHALVLHRVEGVTFATAIFTNLSQDHLDFHSSMEDYFAAKRELFRPDRSRSASINADDPYGRRLADTLEVPALTFGVAVDAAVRAVEVTAGQWGNQFVLLTPAGETKVSSGLVGAFNVSNCLAAAAACLQAGIPLDAIEAGIARLKAVPGRFEAIDQGQPFSVVVDYAHTPDSLDNVLRQARRVAARSDGRVLVLFGCGGDRDRGKRPLMGMVAARLADVVVVTSDNPRSEDPNAIIDEILPGVLAERASGPDLVVGDRAEAIEETIRMARAGDVVVVAGKGHETGQQFVDRTIPFDDREVVRRALADAGWGTAA